MEKKILIVEDEEPLRRLYEEELKGEGYEVLTVCNGKEALSRIETEKPDMMVLDIVMPVMDGMETLGHILGKHRDVPVILNTSYHEYRRDFLSWAADAYVLKSVDLGELKSKICELLRKPWPYWRTIDEISEEEYLTQPGVSAECASPGIGIGLQDLSNRVDSSFRTFTLSAHNFRASPVLNNFSARRDS